jgi:hypothetical protein
MLEVQFNPEDAAHAFVKSEISSAWKEQGHDNQLNVHPRQSANIVQEALLQYGKCFGAREDQDIGGRYRKECPTSLPVTDNFATLSDAQVHLELERDLGARIGTSGGDQTQSFRVNQPLVSDSCTDSDGEELHFCKHCDLPIGDLCYNKRPWCSSKSLYHGECMAQMLAEDMRKKEEARKLKDMAEKHRQHDEYGIGWQVRHIPRNQAAASKLAMRDVPQGMVCLVIDDDSRSIRLASTHDSAMSVNLEYLSTALLVRRREGHEPVFSLEPTNPEDTNSMQEKVFIPDWLAGTKAGEVLFQSDYHLKELSMGQYEQPVVGMRSCFDYAGSDDGFQEWSAREWFIVRKAEMHITDGDVLLPFVKMGVEAREQLVVDGVLDDVPVTRQDHPMVRYAEDFTHNFDLIAERKSVIYHLRELAKASILAKFLLEANVELDESWFYLIEEQSVACSLEIPQLWNRRNDSEILLKHSGIKSGKSFSHGVYGGVQFGLDRFQLSSGLSRTAPLSVGQPAAGLSAVSVPLVPRSGRLQGFQTGLSVTTPPLSAGLSIGEPPQAKKNTFAASLLETRPARLSVTPSAVALSSQVQTLSLRPSPGGVPSLASSLLGRKPTIAGAPPAVMAASLLGKRGVAPAAPPPRLHFGLTKVSGLSPLSVAQPALPAPGGPLSAAQMSIPGAIPSPPLNRAVMAPPRLSAVAGVPRLISALQTAAVAPKFDTPGAPQLQSSLQGVDLRLDSFDLSSATRVSLEAREGSWSHEAKPLDECVTMADAFWKNLEATENFKEQDRSLLSDIFNSKLCDRRLEGDLFNPPDASYAYVTKMRNLVKEEHEVRRKRKEQFFSKLFVMTQPGSLFPQSWTPGFDIAHGQVPIRALEERPQGALQMRPEYRGQAAETLLHAMKQCTAVFDKSTEEGLRFRIYQMGSFEVRTTQELGCEEEVGVVFSACAPVVKGGRKGERIQEDEQITQATEYVERVLDIECLPGAKSHARFRYYLVLETQNGQKIATERLRDGSVTWQEDPEDLEDRNSLAKATRSREALSGLTVRDMIAYHNTMCRGGGAGTTISPSMCKRYVRNSFSRAVSEPHAQCVTQMPARSARLAAEARQTGRPPRWTDVTMVA